MPSMAEVVVIESGFFHGGYITDILDSTGVSWGEMFLRYDESKISNRSNARQMVFGKD